MTTDRFAFVGDHSAPASMPRAMADASNSGYRYSPAPLVGITPYAAVQAQAFHTPTYSETDLTSGGFGLTYNSMVATDARSELGAYFDQLTASTACRSCCARAAWAHDWITNPSLDAVFEALPGASFVVNGASPPTRLRRR